MLIAKMAHHTEINCLDYSRAQLRQLRQQHFYCPACHRQVVLKVGHYLQPHFAHQQRTACLTAEGETAEHLAGKALLGELCRKQQLRFRYEVYLPALQQRPDLLIYHHEENIALEFQCSPISVAKIRSRTQGYRQAGYRVIWILGQRYQNQPWTQRQHAFLQYLPAWGWFQWHLQVRTKRLLLIHHITHQGYPQQMRWQVNLFSDLKRIKKPLRQGLSYRQCIKESTSLYRQLNQVAPKLLSVQQSCYLKGHHLAGAPICCHSPAMPPINRQDSLLLNVELLLLCEQLGKVTLNQLENFCQQRQAAFYQLPLFSHQSWALYWCCLVLNRWVSSGVLSKQGHNWYFLKVHWFQDYFSKVTALKQLPAKR